MLFVTTRMKLLWNPNRSILGALEIGATVLVLDQSIVRRRGFFGTMYWAILTSRGEIALVDSSEMIPA